MDLIEVILKDEVRIYQDSQLQEAIDFLQTLNSPLVLDLHGVLDTISAEVELPIKLNTSCCSYVGRKGSIRAEAAEEIKERILSGQIDFGVLVFKRHEEKRYDIGTKSWYCMLVGAKIFCDDSFDHINYVKSYGIKCLHITKQQPLLKSLGKV